MWHFSSSRHGYAWLVQQASRVAMAQLVCLIGKPCFPFYIVGVLVRLGPTMEISFLGADQQFGS